MLSCARRTAEAPATARPDPAHLGQRQLATTLLKNDLIDEHRLFIYPVALGSGKRFFGSGAVPMALEQVGSVTTGKGVMYHRLEPSGKPEYGQMGN